MPKRFEAAFPQLSILTGGAAFPYDVNRSTLVDLILLTRSRCIICPPTSYFSFCAAKASLATRLKARWDFRHLVPELIGLPDAASPPDISLRNDLDSAYRDRMHAAGIATDAVTMTALIA